MKKETKKVVVCYLAAGIGLILLTGLIAAILGITGCFSPETNQFVTETLSGFAGSLYLAFLFSKIHPKNKQHHPSSRSGLFTAAAGLIFFAARCANRLLLTGLTRVTASKAPYFLSVMLDLFLLAALWLFIPYTGKEAASHE